MNRSDLTEKILDIKREKGWSWKYICTEIGGMSPFMITGALLGHQKLTKPQAAAAAKLFGLSKTTRGLRAAISQALLPAKLNRRASHHGRRATENAARRAWRCRTRHRPRFRDPRRWRCRRAI